MAPALCGLGLGILLGSPMGISAKLCLDRSHAIDLAAGAALIGDGGPDVHVDYLWHPARLADTPAWAIPIYLGLGGRIMAAETHQGNDLHVGVRVPFGIVAELPGARLDIFAEAAVLFDIVQKNQRVVDVDVGFGARCYF